MVAQVRLGVAVEEHGSVGNERQGRSVVAWGRSDWGGERQRRGADGRQGDLETGWRNVAARGGVREPTGGEALVETHDSTPTVTIVFAQAVVTNLSYSSLKKNLSYSSRDRTAQTDGHRIQYSVVYYSTFVLKCRVHLSLSF